MPHHISMHTVFAAAEWQSPMLDTLCSNMLTTNIVIS